MVLAGTGGVGYGLANIADYPAYGPPCLTLGLVAAGTVATIGQRTKSRQETQDRLVEALAPYLGVRELDRRTVQLRRWTGGWPGLPRRILIRYAPGAPDSDPQWKSAITETVNARLLSPYRIDRHDPRRCRLTLALTAPQPDDAPEKSHSLVRAERAISELVGPTATVTDVDWDEETLTALTVSHQAGAKLAASGYRHRIERVISTMLPGRWRATWDLENDTVRFEVRPSLPTSVWLPVEVPAHADDLLENYREVRIPYAVDEDARELAWYPARVPHMMLSGGTGSGKTSMAHALLGKVTQYGWPVWVLDAKRVEFLPFRDWPNVQIVAGTLPQQVALVRRAWELMEYRYELIETGQARVNDFEPLVVFLDEFAEFRNNLAEWYAQIKVKGDPSRPPTLAEVASLARKARTARIHLVLSTQRPDAEFLGGEMRDNFGQRISMGRLSPQGAQMMWENPSVGVTLPRDRTGRAISTHDDGRPVEVQCYRFPDVHAPEGSDEHQLLARLRPSDRRHPRLVIVPPDDEADLDDGEPSPPTFRDYARARWALADDRPDLDPLTTGPGLGATGRTAASTLASLGLTDLGRSGTARAAASQPVEPSAIPSGPEPGALPTWEAEEEEYTGYAPATSCRPHSLMVGDLIEVEEGSGLWVVVDEPPEDDPTAPGLVAISWRGDGDDSGAVSVPEDLDIPVRRPEEDI